MSAEVNISWKQRAREILNNNQIFMYEIEIFWEKKKTFDKISYYLLTIRSKSRKNKSSGKPEDSELKYRKI